MSTNSMQTAYSDIIDHAPHASASASHEVDAETIANLAYQLWSERGKPHGSPEVDWFHAEKLLRAGRRVL